MKGAFLQIDWLRVSLVLIVLLAITGCTRSGAGAAEFEEQNQALEKKISALEKELVAARESTNKEPVITLYFVRNLPTEMWLVPELRKVRPQQNIPKAALDELIKGPTGPDLVSLIPRDTKVLDLSVSNQTAYVNLSPEITRMSVGSMGETLVIAAIANTLIKFPGVERVQILINGQKAESLAGHVDLTGPVGRNERVLLLPSLESR